MVALEILTFPLPSFFSSSGYYLPDENGTCKPCRDGIDFTNSFNKWLSCKICSVCKEDKDEKNRCITTRDTECQCKPESFEDENSPEFCQKCSECTNEEDEVTPCTPKTDRKCVPKGSKLSLIIVILVALAVVLIAVYLVGWKTGLWRRVLQYMKGAYPRRERDCEHEQDSDHSRNLLREETSNVGNDSQYSMEPEVADSSPVGRKLLVPANGNDSVGALKLIFNQCSNIVPFKSWDSLMRQMGLTDNDIQMVRAVTQVPEDTLYQMLLKWLNQTGRSASINNLLDALEAIGERYARDTIEDHAVKTGEFIYQKTTAEPVMMTHICDTSTEET
ncbi:tumor necrosis factor receptor superfamily member 10B [Phodopus roborovskii]|uniref:tumor necrosis factor receptor superfamily member 10B n=1 Tax=Phodopus roborovskii TaxID=109678 RepID=UPI0021E4C8ED|nr:tumor necrosis factor receptor superfamily member 10B [Phodopus roborovskii]